MFFCAMQGGGGMKTIEWIEEDGVMTKDGKNYSAFRVIFRAVPSGGESEGEGE